MWLQSGHHGCGLLRELLVVVCLSHSRRDIADATTCSDALSILAKYAIAVPEAVKSALAEGALETPKPGDQRFVRNSVRVIATPNDSLKAAAEEARAMGIKTRILSDDIEGESRDVGKVHAALARYGNICMPLGRSCYYPEARQQ